MKAHKVVTFGGAVAFAGMLAACGIPVPSGCQARVLGTADEVEARTSWSCVDFGQPPGQIAGGATWYDGGPIGGSAVAASVDCAGPGHVYDLYGDAPPNPSADECVLREYNG